MLKRLRETAMLSQELLAERARISTRTVSDLERGVNKTARRFTADLLATALELEGDLRNVFLVAASGRPVPHETAGVSSDPAGDRLIGRETELRELGGVLTSGAGRVSLVGPGGVGKTRLAQELSERHGGQWPAPPVWIDLAGIDHAEVVFPHVASALEVTEAVSEPLDAIRRHQQDHHGLIVLDNAEHLVDAVRELVPALGPHATVLVTSRAPLRVPGERVVRLGPLASSFAVELFRVRAAAVGAAWSEADAPSVAELCERLDGMPLAIELAAARSRLLAPADLAGSLNLDMLAARSGSHPERHRTMRAVVEWSYALAGEAERDVLGRCSVFRGGFDAVTAQRIVGRDCLDDLESLLDASLLSIDESADRPRLEMLETILEYAGERLAADGDASSAQSAHLAWCVDLACQAEDRLVGEDQGAWLGRLELEHDNLRAAISSALRQDSDAEAGSAERLAAGLWRFWYLRGYLSEGRRWIDLVLDRPLPEDAESAAARARASYGAGVLTWMQGDLVLAEARARDAYDALMKLEMQAKAANPGMLIGMIAQYRGDHDVAAECFENALEIGRSTGDRRVAAVALTNLGSLASAVGDDVAADRVLRQSLVALGELGDGRGQADVLGNLAEIAVRQGRLDEARGMLDRCLVEFDGLGDQTGLSETRQALARVALQRRNPREAQEHWEAVLALSAELADPWGRAAARTGLAEVAELEGGPAVDRYLHALDLHRDLDHTDGVVQCLEGLLRLAEQHRDEPAAARWRSELDTVRQRLLSDVARAVQRPCRRGGHRLGVDDLLIGVTEGRVVGVALGQVLSGLVDRVVDPGSDSHALQLLAHLRQLFGAGLHHTVDELLCLLPCTEHVRRGGGDLHAFAVVLACGGHCLVYLSHDCGPAHVGEDVGAGGLPAQQHLLRVRAQIREVLARRTAKQVVDGIADEVEDIHGGYSF